MNATSSESWYSSPSSDISSTESIDDVTYEYDALDRRVQRDNGTTATVFVQNGQQTFADYTSGTAATSSTYNYVYASYIDEPVYRDGTGGERYFQGSRRTCPSIDAALGVKTSPGARQNAGSSRQ